MVLRQAAHSKHDLKYHFVWCPKYRKMVLSGNIGRYTARIIYEIAERYDFEIIELAVMNDHIHMFVSAGPDMSPAQLVQIVKSITGKELFRKFPSIKQKLWGGALWERGYFVMSSGTVTTDEMIQKYIKEQRLPREANDQQPTLFG